MALTHPRTITIDARAGRPGRRRAQITAAVVAVAIAGAGKVLEREVNEATHADLLNKLAAEI